MIITVIGSISKSSNQMIKIKEYFEKFGDIVNIPCEEKHQSKPLVSMCYSWIEKIECADLIIAVAKKLELEKNGSGKQTFEFGESTTYELAIATYLEKPIMYV